jgi:hypothetical protein
MLSAYSLTLPVASQSSFSASFKYMQVYCHVSVHACMRADEVMDLCSPRTVLLPCVAGLPHMVVLVCGA